VYSGCKFNDRLMYATQQSKPNRGFMTSDYHRRCDPPRGPIGLAVSMDQANHELLPHDYRLAQCLRLVKPYIYTARHEAVLLRHS
jgi:hypothetical protein